MGRRGELGRVFEFLGNTQAWRSFARHGWPIAPRNRAIAIMSNVILHLHPIRLRRSALRLKYNWCMGGLTFWLFVIETITNLLLMFYYRPTAEYAYADIQYLRADVPLGILRELHRWGAHAMVITVWLHMMRVFLTGSYKPPREFNWGIGVVLMVLTLLLSFTGYLLLWDQLAMWAVTVGTNMARATPFAGHEGPGATLLVVGDVNLIHATSDARALLLGGGGALRGGRDDPPLLRAPLRRISAAGRVPDGCPLLARAQGRRHFRAALIGSTSQFAPKTSGRASTVGARPFCWTKKPRFFVQSPRRTSVKSFTLPHQSGSPASEHFRGKP